MANFAAAFVGTLAGCRAFHCNFAAAFVGTSLRRFHGKFRGGVRWHVSGMLSVSLQFRGSVRWNVTSAVSWQILRRCSLVR